MKYFIIFLFLITGCSTPTITNIIFIDISPDKLILEKKEIEKSTFEKELRAVIDMKIKEGFNKDELTINLRVDKQTRRGDIADLQTTMRRLNMRKIIYSTFDEETEGVNAGLSSFARQER